MRAREIYASALVSLAVLSTAAAPVGSAQAADAPRLEPGARVRVTVMERSSDGRNRTREIDGTYVALSDSTLTIQPDTDLKEVETQVAANVEIPRANVMSFEARVRKGRKTQGALIGFLVGGAFGAVLGYSAGDDPPGFMSFSAGAKAGMGAVTFSFLGAGVSALAAPGEQWAPVSTHEVQVGIGGGPGGATGLVVAMRF